MRCDLRRQPFRSFENQAFPGDALHFRPQRQHGGFL